MRAYLADHRHDLAVKARQEYPEAPNVEGTPLLAPPGWLPDEPVPLDHIALRLDPDATFDGVTGTENVAQGVLPVRRNGSRYRSYSDAVAELAAPSTFENRPTYRLTDAELRAEPRMGFGLGGYFQSLDVGAACAHEYASATLGDTTEQPLRHAVGDPCDPTRRPVNVAISAMVMRHDRTAGQSTFLMHRRNPAAVGHAGGMYQVVPVGVFQPTGSQPSNVRNDFSLWWCIVREFAEELLGEPERHGQADPIDYESWPTAARLTEALSTGRLRTYCLGLGVDPLTLATDLLTVVVIDAATYDELLAGLVATNPEGAILPALPFTADAVERFAGHEPTQAAGAALLRLAWKHRRHLLG